MKSDMIKLKIQCFANRTIDAYVPPTTIFEKLKNSTMKLWVEQNIGKIEPILNMFVDKDGDIDIMHIIAHYEDDLFENGELRVNVKESLPQEYDIVKEMLPNKVILFKKNDLIEIFS